MPPNEFPPLSSGSSINGVSQSPSPTPTTSTLQTLFFDAVEHANPPLRQLASDSTSGSLLGVGAPDLAPASIPGPRQLLGVTLDEQRHPGKQGLGHDITGRRLKPPHSLTQPCVNNSSSAIGIGERGYSRTRSRLGNHNVNPNISGLEEGKETGGIEVTPRCNQTNGRGEVDDNKPFEEDGEEITYPGPLAFTMLIIGLCLSVFLISLDRTIITTATPFISNEFNSVEDIGWYGSSYLLTASAFQPLYGRIFTLFNMKWSYLISLSMFLAGSLVCGIAPNSVTLIIGRSIAGLGSAGILTGSFVVVSHAMPLSKRPFWTAVVGLMFGVGATIGPLLGGVFTDLVSWRWCFYFNLPVGGATLFAMLCFFHPPKKHALAQKSILYRIGELDLIGNAILLGASIMLFLALQFTERQIPWSSALIIGLLVGAGMTFIVFCVWQWWKADAALIPPRIVRQRSVGASCMVGFFVYAAILIQTYYLPIWFQAVKGYSAVQSGVAMIPYVAASALASLLAGIFVSKNGYFTAPAIIGCAIGTVGCGFISTITPSTSSAKWIGYEILASAGIGFAIQQGFSAVQIVLPLEDVAMGTAAVVAFQSLGGAVFVSVGNTILQNVLLSAAHNNQLPGVDIDEVIKAGASEFRKKVPPEVVPELIAIYHKALQKVFVAAIPMAGLAFVSSLFLEWRSVKDRKVADEEARDKWPRAELERRIIDKHHKPTGPLGHPPQIDDREQMGKETEVEVASPSGSSGTGVGIAL